MIVSTCYFYTLVLLVILCTTTTATMKHSSRIKFLSPLTYSKTSSSVRSYNTILQPVVQKKADISDKVSYVKAPIPTKLLRCIENSSILKCIKLYVLQRIEQSCHNVTSHLAESNVDFFNELLRRDSNGTYLVDEHYWRLADNQLDDKLLTCFRSMFKDRKLTLHFIPGMVVKFVANEKNQLDFSVKNVKRSFDESGREKKNDYSSYMQIAVPAFFFPPMLLSSVLPFLIPAFKMATVFSTVLNSSALMAAIMYLARQHALEQEQKQTIYFNPGYH